MLASRVLGHMIGPLDSERGDGERRLELDKFGIEVEEPWCRERILGVLRSFFDGFETAISRPSRLDERRGPHEPLYYPFYYEGAAMGYGARQAFRFRLTRSMVAGFEREATSPDHPFAFLQYVGLGFWLGFRFAGYSRAIDFIAEGLQERRLRHLLHDGYGFQLGFFRLRKKPRLVDSIRSLEGFGRASAFNGLGRSLWFFHMDRPEAAMEAARAFEDDKLDVFGGMGLAATFTRVDDLSRPYSIAEKLEGGERRAFEKGIRIALFCRHENDAEFLESSMVSLEVAVRERVRADLDHALRVGEATRRSDEFIAEFHDGCSA